ncbi:MAG: hypothetical protein EPO51_04725 [Phenylobacterium sp.]|uniref:hypothetical protein n=1 Tax=Phenylobacterium sp. TaxID=1871053 RepID=UPI00121BDA84|nr:hypothetical protein [Phenylobacterium sp.]TAJ73599.1 MAG: hypothetical protein EPO51_04725 [Phenylobacterium sp.]
MANAKCDKMSALVARIPGDGDYQLRFLRIGLDGFPEWGPERSTAARLPSLRHANHVASLLPDGLKAFGLLDG